MDKGDMAATLGPHRGVRTLAFTLSEMRSYRGFEMSHVMIWTPEVEEGGYEKSKLETENN